MTKADLKNAAGVDILKFPKKVDSLSLKSEFHKLHIGKLEITTVDLSKWCSKNEFVKTTISDELVKNVKAIQTTDTSNLVKKTDFDRKIGHTEKKITKSWSR